jgi:hypothetical protein
MVESTLTHERLLAALQYDPQTGIFRWKIRTSIRVMVGQQAGSIVKGYVEIGLDGVHYQAHRLAWFYMTGEWPALQVDHKDTNRANNAWFNLREATHGQNVTNSGPRRNNRTGLKGVTPFNGRWHARIMHDGALHLLGYFDSPEAAHAAYARKAHELHGEFARVA